MTTPTRPNLGSYALVAIGKQETPGTPVEPTIGLRSNGQGSSPVADTITSPDQYANGSVFQDRSRFHGATWTGKQIGFEMEKLSAVMLLEAICGSEVAAGIITPINGNFAPDTPGIPLTLEWNYPGFPIIASDVQVTQVDFNVNGRSNITGSATFNGSRINDLADPTAVTIPGMHVFGFMHHYMQIDLGGGYTTVRPETSSLSLASPQTALDASQGLTPADAVYSYGNERSGPMTLTGTFNLPGAQKALYDRMRANSTVKLRWGVAIGGVKIEFDMPTAEITSAAPPATLQRIVTPINWSAASNGGALPFTITVA